MKNITLFITSILIAFSIGANAQSREDHISKLLDKDTSISKDFKNKMIAVGLSLNCDPWNDDPCDDLCNPWDDTPCNEQIKSQTKKDPNTQQKQIIIIIMKKFEVALTKGNGGTVITKKNVQTVQNKHPGFTLKAMRVRFSSYASFECWPSK